MRIVSWNVNGIRAIVQKDFAETLNKLNADVLCFQETKADPEQVNEALKNITEYEKVAYLGEKKGYSGTAILYKEKPLSINYGIGINEHDNEGRVITAEFLKFFLVTVYTPNSGSELKRLDYRQQWDQDFLVFLKNLEKTKPVIICGDLNVAHQAIDLKNPKPNYNKSAGYMQEEIDGFDNLMKAGFVDTYRYLNPETIKYSWWSYRAGARAKNVGWRIDYFLVSDSIKGNVKNAEIHNEAMGSDHCAVSVELEF